jgi:hypothetical protein
MIGTFKNIPLFFFLLMLASVTFAQQGGIRGQLADTVGHEVLKGAIITLTNTPDSSFTRRIFTKEDASFNAYPLPYGSYVVRITFQGFEPLLRVIHLNREHPRADMGTLYLKIRISELDSVLVEEPPMILKKDTLVYNASRWHIQPYAPVAGLLAVLPGVQVNSDGSLTVNGQPVDRILVDGKPFFDGDPKMALNHLPAEILSQIQVYQTADQQSARLGIAGTSGNKTLNLVLKNNRRRGDFGKAGAGAGPDGVYAAVLDLHHMNGKQQLSVVGDAGNVDGLNTGKSGGEAVIAGSGEYGISRQWNGGINYRDTWNDRMDINGSFLSNRQHTQDTRQMHMLNLFPGDSSTILDQQVISIIENSRQQMKLTVENKLNATSSITIRPNLQMQHTKSRSSVQSMQTSGQTAAVIYQSSANNTKSSDAQTASADILFMHKGSKPSRSFSAGLSIYGHQNRSNSINASHTDYAVPAVATSNFNQHVANTRNFFNLSPSITYTIPVTQRDVLDLQSNYLYNSSSSRNQAFRYNEATHEFDLPDSSQSNDFNTIYNTARALVSYRLQRGHCSIVLGAGIESDHLQGKDLSDNSIIKRRFTSFLPSADLIIRQDNGRSIQVSYNGKPVALTVLQLQPVITTADSLSIQQGNPLLKQPFTHSFILSYSSIRTGSQRFFNAMISGSTTENAIQNSVTLLNNGAQVFKPVNMKGSANIYANANYTMSLARQRTNLGLTGSIRYSRDPVLSNGQESDTRMLNLSGAASCSFNGGKGLSFDINAASAYNIVHYSQDMNQMNDYFTATFSSRVMYVFGDRSVSLTESYSWNNSLPPGYQPGAPILSLTVSHRLFKRKEGEIKFSIADLLNQQSGALRTATPNSITDMTARIRGRYAMLSFIYNVSRFKAGILKGAKNKG